MKFRPNADMMASVLVHLLLLALIFLYSEVHQFDPVAADTMPVEVVTPQEVAEVAPDPTPTPELQLPSLDKPTESAAAQPEAQAPAPQPPEKQATPPAPQPEQKQATPQPAPQPSPTPRQMAKVEQPPAPQPPPPVAQQSPPPAYTRPEPDPSVKYHVMLGLPPYLPAETPPAEAPTGPDAGKDNFDAPATEKADIGSGVVAEFRRHLKTCMKLPATLSTSDDVRVKLRVFMRPDGKLAAAPQLIEASASMKGPLLMQSATSALQACQPYAMLPRDRYGEWKVLDLDFTPRDFAS
ncbi:hypothetical protein [Bradyrhizobium sp. ISRA464]|uniref:hypothetical protein n=2 Tax=unclassified Bradyrhizobium TaxID=2631580 RepID=UPI002479A15B|nr:hypothetical protein [Bradyrhizobium sp. ISRA464]WGS30589.1 hypothetical protein MTX19_16975 [Bradyrhizobium sp. ISRA464]